MTLSFWAKANITTNLRAAYLIQAFGSGGSPSSSVTTTLTLNSTSINSSWSKYTATVTLPSISGKTIGTTPNTSYLQVRVDVPINTAGTYDFSHFQLEVGGHATTFEKRTIGEEIRLCQRYYCKTYEIDVAPGTGGTSGFVGGRQSGAANYVRDWQYPVNMRGTPTVTAYSHSTGTAGMGRNLNTATDVSASFQNTNSTTTNFIITGGAGADGQWLGVQITADAEL